MEGSGFRKLFWGFLFTFIDFRINGIDIMPDIVGYIILLIGLGTLSLRSGYFEKARTYGMILMVLSIFSIYQRPNNAGGVQMFGGGFSGTSFMGIAFLGFILIAAAMILDLLLVYNICSGIKELSAQREKLYIADRADSIWKKYLYLQLSFLLVYVIIFIPPIAILFIIVMAVIAIVITITLMKFMLECERELE